MTQTVVVWGASGGIGRAVCHIFKMQNWQVIAVARNTEDLDDYRSFEADIFNRSELDRVNYQIAMEWQEVDLIIYSIGSIAYQKLENLSSDDWSNTISSNLTGAFEVWQSSQPTLAPDGAMYFIGAYIDHLQLPKMGAYVAAKAGLQELVHILRKENRKQKYVVVRPGAVDTKFWDSISLKLPTNAKAPSEVAKAIFEHHQSGSDDDLNL